MSDSRLASEVLWEGSPWVVPGLIGLTIEGITAVVLLSWLELFVVKVSSLSILGITYLLIAVLWLAGATRLELIKASNQYTLRGSSLEVTHGIVGKRVFTVSAAGFSDLEVTKTLVGRILNMGSIVVETDSDRDIRLTRIKDPMKVATMLREVMTVPLVRVAGEASPPGRSSGAT